MVWNYFCSMDQYIEFIKIPTEYDYLKEIGRIWHILCTDGAMNFKMGTQDYEIKTSDFAIWIGGMKITDISISKDFNGIIMAFEENYYYTYNSRSNYETIGQLTLSENPVINLTEKDVEIIKNSMIIIQQRYQDTANLFYKELLSAYLKAHVYEIFGIHSRLFQNIELESRPAIIMAEFLKLLEKKEFMKNRSTTYFAKKLSVSPHYLTEVSNRLSHHPASFWIDRFTFQELMVTLRKKKQSLTQLADEFKFSSLSHLSNFIKKYAGVSPKYLIEK